MSTWSAGGIARGSRGPPSTLCRRRHPPVRPPGLVGDPDGARFGKAASARRILRVLGALLAAMIASAALLGTTGAYWAASAGGQPPPTPPTSSQPVPPEQPPEQPSDQQGLPVSGTLRNVDGTLLAGVQVRVFDA